MADEPITSAPTATPSPASPRLTRRELGGFSLRMGAIGFGGGLSVLGSMRSTAVERQGWMTAREFDSTAIVAQMLPGGAAANALALIGLRMFGTRGALLAYWGFILPGFAGTVALAVAYERLGGAPQAAPLLAGLAAAVVGIVAAMTLNMVRTSIGRPWQMVVASIALAMSLEGGAAPGEIALLGIGAGLVLDLGTKRARLARARRISQRPAAPVGLPDEGAPLRGGSDGTLRAVVTPVVAALALAAAGTTALSLSLVFLRTGLGAYGGGFAIVPHLKATLVGTLLTDRQFADAVAVGKITPGPVLLMATFIGYLKGGLAGAIVSTAAIFCAPLVLTVALGGWLARYRSRRVVRAALRGLTPAVVGTIAAAGITLAGPLEGTEVAIAAAVTLTLVRFRVNPALLLALGGGARVLLTWAGW